jgi:antitoxin YefM
MIAVRATDLKNDFKNVCHRVSTGITVVVPRPKNENIVLLSEKRYNELEYLEKLELARKQSAEGLVVSKAMTELEAME